MGRQPEQGPGPRRVLRVQGNKWCGFHVPSIQRVGPNHISLCGPCGGFRDSGDDSIDAREAIERSHVERGGVGIFRECNLLFPGSPDRLLGVWAGCCGQCSRGAGKTGLANCCR